MWAIAWPMMVSNLSVPLLGLVDTVVMAYLPSPSFLAAVSLGSLIFGFLFWGFGFLRMSTSGLTAQSMGSNNYSEVRLLLLRSVTMAMALSLVIWLAQSFLGAFALTLINPSAEVTTLTLEYFRIRIWSAPAVLVTYACVGWCIGLQNSRAAMRILIATNLANIVLDLLFVNVFGWQIKGVAWASVVAEYFGLIVSLFSVRALSMHLPGKWRFDRLFQLEPYLSLFRINFYLFVRTLALLSAFAYFSYQGAQMGDLILAANALLLNFQNMMAYALDGFAHSAEARVGRAIGRKDGDGLRQAISAAFIWSFAASLGFSLVYLLFGSQFINWMTDQPELQVAAKNHIYWVALLPLASFIAFLLDGVFTGLARATEMAWSMLVALAIFYLLTALLVPAWSNHGLWAAFAIFTSLRGVLLFVSLLFRGKPTVYAVEQSTQR